MDVLSRTNSLLTLVRSVVLQGGLHRTAARLVIWCAIRTHRTPTEMGTSQQVFSRRSHPPEATTYIPPEAMPPKKTPTSSLSGAHTVYFLSPHLTTITATAIELLVKRVLYRTLARARRMYSGGVSPETSRTRLSPATRLPQEIVGTIIAYLTFDTRSLRACTLTCYSWYIAAVPHLHHTLAISTDPWDQKFLWPNPIRYMHMLGLLPLVKKFQVHGGSFIRVGLSPKLFNCCILRQFLALTNVQELDLEHLDIPNFMPRIRRYFGHFSHTVRSLSLREPRGSRRQIIYFIGLFQHLQDLTLIYDRAELQEEPEDDLTLIPPFAPPLRGWIKVVRFTRVGLLKDMIDLFGGIRFRYMYLLDVDGMQLLLGACAKTLEVVVLDPTDPRGEQISLACKLLPMILQPGPPCRTLIYHGTSHSIHSRSQRRLSVAT